MPVLNKPELDTLAQQYDMASPEEILATAVQQIENLALACSFGAEDMVLLDMLMKISPNTKVFYLDTDVLFPETYQLIERAVEKYGIPNLIQIRPLLSLNEQSAEYGDGLWARQPDVCCDLRKVQPLQGFLSTLDGWITGIRRDQARTRANAKAFEEDGKFSLVKVNPLIRWTEVQVWEYLQKHEVPYNPLHDAGYPSIGCIHCTRPVQPGEDPRSGRWSGFQKTECGLHK